MAKYNEKRVSIPEVKPIATFEGGHGFSQKIEKELVGILSVGLSNTFYEKETDREKRFREVISAVAQKDPVFAAKALIYARTVFGQRSVTHYGAVELLKFLSGTELAKKFYSKRDRKENRGGIIYRLDDMAEILACYQAKNSVDAPIPNAIKKGFKDAIEHADTYTLAKYQMKSRGVSLVDIVNLVHPVETKANGTVVISGTDFTKAIKGTKFAKTEVKLDIDGNVTVPALKALMLGLLKQFNTAEDKNTSSGQAVAAKLKSGEITANQATVQLNEAKTDNYAELIDTKKIGYLALVRQLRQILNTNNTVLLDKACTLLVDEAFIKKSLVFPHQIDLALEIMIAEFGGAQLQKVAKALNEAYEKSIPNLAELFNDGRTAVVLDTSGSMNTRIHVGPGKSGSTSALDKGALIAATLAKGIGAKMFVFADRCAKVTYNPLDSVHSLKNSLIANRHGVGGGTSWGVIFPYLQQHGKFDRVFLISDEQGADNVERSYKSYCDTHGTPNTFVINMCGYAATMIKENTKVHRLYGYSAAIYETAKQVEIDIQAVINEINKIII